MANRFLTSNWKLPELPGVNQHSKPGVTRLPPGATTNYALTSRQVKDLKRLLRTFDNPKCVRAIAPYAESAEEFVQAVLDELGAQGYAVGPAVVALVETSGLQHMWQRFLSDRAAEQVGEKVSPEDTRLIALSNAVGDSMRNNLLAAKAEQQKSIAAERAVVQARDPLDVYDAPAAPPREPSE